MPNVLNDHRMDYLFEAVRLGSIRAAADVLEVNPSVISRQIAQLEKDIGVTLIERLSRGVRATQAGLLLTQRHRQWMADREDTIAKLREIQGLKRGHIDIVLGEGFVSDLMAGPLLQFWQRHPQLTMSVELAGTSEVVASVAEDRAHIGMVYNPPHDPRLRVVAASRQPIRLVARPDHPLAKSPKPPTLADIAAYPLGLMYLNYGTRQVVKLAEAAEKIVIAPKLTTSSINVLRHFVCTGMGVTLLPAFSITADIAEGGLVALLIDNPMLAATEAQVITRTGRELPSAASDLLRFLISHMLAFRTADC
jgi:DNA-binding transcriptional LysR family regulator